MKAFGGYWLQPICPTSEYLNQFLVLAPDSSFLLRQIQSSNWSSNGIPTMYLESWNKSLALYTWHLEREQLDFSSSFFLFKLIIFKNIIKLDECMLWLRLYVGLCNKSYSKFQLTTHYFSTHSLPLHQLITSNINY